MATNPYVNKVIFGSATLVDLTGTTATADKILQGYGAFGADGAWMNGTATSGNVWQDQDGYVHLDDEGGGSPSVGGLVYETGTWTPSEDVADYTISFVNTHTTAPFYYVIMDVGTTYNSTSNSNAGVIYYIWGQAFGEPLHYSSSSIRYGYARRVNSSGGVSSASIAYPHTSTTDTITSYPRYWAKETGIKAEPYGSGYYWRAGRTYKWIAIWTPT